jgi:hypothetical protein
LQYKPLKLYGSIGKLDKNLPKTKIASVQAVIMIPVAILVVAIILINLPDLLGAHFFTVTDKTNIVLTLVLAMFAVIQGISAYIQVNMEKKRNEIQALSDELEKAYGPIYAILSKPVREGENNIEVLVREKLVMDEKLSAYRSMFSANITDYWEKNIRKIEPCLSTDALAGAKELMRGSHSTVFGMIDVYKIPVEFVEIFTAEYIKKTEFHRELLKKS